jgi:hypothetical protein
MEPGLAGGANDPLRNRGSNDHLSGELLDNRKSHEKPTLGALCVHVTSNERKGKEFDAAHNAVNLDTLTETATEGHNL